MSLITVEELQTEATNRDIDISSYSESYLETLISQAQTFIETETGGIFDLQTFTEKLSGRQLNGAYSLLLTHTPLISITSLTIDDTLQTEDTDYYITNNDIGKLEFETSLPYDGINNIIIEYTAGYNPSHPLAIEVCYDILFAGFNNSTGSASEVIQNMIANASSIKEGDITIGFKNSTTSSSSTTSSIGASGLPDVSSKLALLKRFYSGMI